MNQLLRLEKCFEECQVWERKHKYYSEATLQIVWVDVVLCNIGSLFWRTSILKHIPCIHLVMLFSMQATAGTVCALNPTHLWRHFWHLTQIPRPSGYEGKVSQYVKDLAAKKNLKWVEDATGNLVVKMPGSGEYMDSASVMIQGHLDMVCEKNSSVQVWWNLLLVHAVYDKCKVLE